MTPGMMFEGVVPAEMQPLIKVLVGATLRPPTTTGMVVVGVTP